MGKYNLQTGYRKNRQAKLLIFPITLALMVSIFLFQANSKPPTDIQIGRSDSATHPTSSDSKPIIPEAQIEIESLEWPEYGQAAYGTVDDGVLAKSTEESEPVPIASLAKVITALAVLEKNPMQLGEQGPTITLNEEDEAIYREYVAKDGSVVPVQSGEEITQYQALQAMLLPSANNISDSLVKRVFGSIEEYNKYANDMLARLGLTKTTVADASGYSPDTKSTASEMVKIGILYMEHEVLREIARQPNAVLPFAGEISNLNNSINDNQVMGLKIGYTDEAGRTFLVADIHGETKEDISVAAVLGADSWSEVMQDTKELLNSGNNEHVKLKNKDIP